MKHAKEADPERRYAGFALFLGRRFDFDKDGEPNEQGF